MKRLFVFIIILFPHLIFGQKANIEFQEISFDFGNIKEKDGKVSHIFQFKNIGTTPLIVKNIKVGCGCTTTEWERHPILPGSNGNIKVTFDPHNRPGTFTKTIIILSNAAKSHVTLTIKGKVIPTPNDPYKYQIGAIKFKNKQISLGEILNTKTKKITVKLINTSQETVILKTTPSHKAIQIAPTITLPKGDTTNIEILYHTYKKNDWGYVSDQIHFVDHKQNKGTIYIIGIIKEDFSFYQKNFANAPAIQLSEQEKSIIYNVPNTTHSHVFYIKNRGKSDLTIRKTNTSDKEVSISLPKQVIKPGETIQATIKYKSAKKSPTTKLIQLINNDPMQQVATYKLFINRKT